MKEQHENTSLRSLGLKTAPSKIPVLGDILS